MSSKKPFLVLECKHTLKDLNPSDYLININYGIALKYSRTSK